MPALPSEGDFRLPGKDFRLVPKTDFPTVGGRGVTSAIPAVLRHAGPLRTAPGVPADATDRGA